MTSRWGSGAIAILLHLLVVGAAAWGMGRSRPSVRVLGVRPTVWTAAVRSERLTYHASRPPATPPSSAPRPRGVPWRRRAVASPVRDTGAAVPVADSAASVPADTTRSATPDTARRVEPVVVRTDMPYIPAVPPELRGMVPTYSGDAGSAALWRRADGGRGLDPAMSDRPAACSRGRSGYFACVVHLQRWIDDSITRRAVRCRKRTTPPFLARPPSCDSTGAGPPR